MIRWFARGTGEALVVKKERSGPDRAVSTGEGTDRAATGIAGLDDVLAGGFARGRLHLVQGSPGAGKTTLALQFLLAGAARGESGLLISLSETEDELRAAAFSHGWSLDSIHIHDVSALEQLASLDFQQSVFQPAEIELTETTQKFLALVEKIKPARVVFDPITELRLLAGDPMRYRRQIFALKQAFVSYGSAVLLIEDRVDPEQSAASLVHSIIELEQAPLGFGRDQRRLRVQKVRGRAFREGFHDFSIEAGGLRVYPALVAAEHRGRFIAHQVSSGLPALDSLLGGGPDEGTSTLLIGPSGVGKSSLAVQYACAAASRGDFVLFLMFDERLETLFARAAGLGMDFEEHVDAGRIEVRPIASAELSLGQFVQVIRTAVEQRDARLVVIDSLSGYLSAMPGETAMMPQLHELLAYLGQKAVTTLLIYGQKGLFTVAPASSDLDISYLTDNVLLFRYYEHNGEVRQALSVFKRRGGPHERTIRDLRLGPKGIEVGPQLRDFRGVLTGQPIYTGSEARLGQA
jgi:circadian clock protein KaiC